MLNKKVFGQRIKALRIQNQITQSTLGNLLGVTKTQISDIENDKISTTLEKACLLSDYFNVSLDYLVGHTDNPDTNR